MKAISNKYTKTLLLTLMLVMGVSVCGFGQMTLVLQNPDDIKAAPGEPKQVPYGDGNGKLQATHVLRQTIYVDPGNTKATKTLRKQAQGHVNAYQRWFRYDIEEVLPATGFTANGDLLANAGGKYQNSSSNATVTSEHIGKSFACDASRNASTTYSSGKVNYRKEPILSYRMIYDIRSAAEIADTVMGSSTLKPVEYYDMVAPTGMQLLIGPKYPFNDAESNYYTSTTDNEGNKTYTYTSLGTSGQSKFYWE